MPAIVPRNARHGDPTALRRLADPGAIRPPVPDVAHGMSNLIVRRAAVELRRLRFLGPVLLAAAALIVAACNNGSGGTGY